MKDKHRTDWIKVCILCNVITNLTLNIIISIITNYTLYLVALLILEILIVIIEGNIYCKVMILRQRLEGIEVSIILNACSVIIGPIVLSLMDYKKNFSI